MSPIAEKILHAAYENYLKTGDSYFVYPCTNSTDWLNAITGIKQLAQDGLIDEIPDFVLSGVRAPVLASLDFNITAAGIEKICIERESKG